MTPRSRAVLGIAAGAAALILFFLCFVQPTFGSEPHVKRYETMNMVLVFDWNGTENRTQSLTLDMTLGPDELKGMDKAQVLVNLKHTELSRYPGSAAGELTCTILININGKQWDRQIIHFGYTATPNPAEWPPNHDQILGSGFEGSYPSTYESADATDDLDPSGDNHIQSTITCTMHVDSAGPSLSLIEFGGITAQITS